MQQTFTNEELWEMANKAKAEAKGTSTPETNTMINYMAALGEDISTPALRDFADHARKLELEVLAWRERFPQHKYRAQDDVVALK